MSGWLRRWFIKMFHPKEHRVIKEFNGLDNIRLRGEIHFKFLKDVSKISSIRKESGMFVHKIIKNNLSPIHI